MEDNNEPTEAVCDQQDLENAPQIPAKLIQGDDVFADGLAALEKSALSGVFWPATGKPVDLPNLGTELKLTDRPYAIPLVRMEWCAPGGHYHFQTLPHYIRGSALVSH